MRIASSGMTRLVLLSVTVLAMLHQTGLAASRTWDGGGATGNFEDKFNWDGDATVPANNTTSDTVNFTAAFLTGANQPTLTVNRSIAAVVFADGASGWNLGGAFTLSLGTSGISFGTTAANSGQINISATLGTGTGQRALRATGTGTIVVDGSVTNGSGGSLLIGGSTASSLYTGTVILNNADALTGGITIGSGTLRVTNATANVGDVTVTNHLGSGTITIGNSFTTAAGNNPLLDVLINGQDDNTAQILTYGNALIANESSATSTIHIGRFSGSGTNKVVAFGVAQIGVGSALNLTADNGYNYKLDGILTRDSTTDTGGFLINPTGTSVTVGTLSTGARPDRTNILQLGGDAASTANLITGAVTDNTGRYATIGINKVNNSVWRIQSGSNTYTGQTTVTAGTLKLETGAQLGFGGYVLRAKSAASTGTTVNSGAFLDLAGATSLNESITLSGTLTNSSASTATVSSGIAAVTISGTGGSYTSLPNVSFSGGGGSGATADASLGLLAGNISLTNGGSGYGSSGTTWTITEGSNTSARVNGSQSGGVITSISLPGAGLGYTPGASITVTVASGAASISVDNSTLGVSGIRVTDPGSGYSTAPTVTVGSGGATATAVLSGVILSGTGIVGGTGDINLAGVVSGSGNLSKIDNNTVTLGNANSFTGNVTISGGSLLINGSHSGGGTYSVTAGALGGTGTITPAAAKSITLTTGGAIATGNAGIGSLALSVTGGSAAASVANVDLSGGGKMLWQLGALTTIGAGTSFDQLVVNGTKPGSGTTKLILGGTSELTLDLSGVSAPTPGDAFWDNNHQWKIIDTTGSITTASTFTTLNNASFTAGTFSTAIGSGADANDVMLFWTTAAPEPASLSLLALPAGGLLRRRRRR
jgi:autotransporter-associated beta strand protein